MLNKSSIFKKQWSILEEKKNFPSKLRKLKTIEYEELKKKVESNDEEFARMICKSIFEGDCYIIKNAFSKKFFDDLRDNVFQYFKNKPSSFYKMLENKCPDFHRIITKEIGLKYSFKACKHSFYFFPWNNDDLQLFEPINLRWRVLKKIMGLSPTEYENNTPKDGIVDRIQVVQYTSKDGFLETHTDPFKFQKFFISGYMSKKGEDYKDGGFYLIDTNNKKIDAEKMIDVGDMGIGYATVQHGVDPVNLEKEPNIEDRHDGRWFLGLYSNQSDEVKNRHTAKASN